MTDIAKTRSLNGTGQSPVLARPYALLAALLCLWFGLLALFALVPVLDIMAAGRFFTAEACAPGTGTGPDCGRFAWADIRALVVLRYLLYYLPHLFGVILLVQVLRAWKNPNRFEPGFARRGWIYLLALIAGPVILVNGILKQVSGRPRPYQTDLFGGDLDFHVAGDFAGKCLKNCSFISGEASGMGWIVCLIILLPERFRIPGGAALVAASLVGAGLRVAFGGHYASDAILGYLSSIVLVVDMAVIIGWPSRVRN